MDEKRRKQQEYHAALDRQVRDKAVDDQSRRYQNKQSTNFPPLAPPDPYKSPDRVLPVRGRPGKENVLRRDDRNAAPDEDLALLVGAVRGDQMPHSIVGAMRIDGVGGPEGYAGGDVVGMVQQLAGEVSRQAAASARLHQRHSEETRTLRDRLHRCEAQVVEAQAGRKAAELKARLAADSAASPQAPSTAAAAAANAHAVADTVAKMQHDVHHLQLELNRERHVREEAATAAAAERASLAAANRQIEERCAGLEDLLRREHAERLASEDRLRANVHDSRQACAPLERVATLELALQRESQARTASIADTSRGFAAAQAQAAQDLRSARADAEGQARAAASTAADSTRALRLDLVSQLEGLERRTTQASAESQTRLEAQVGEALRLVHRQAKATEAAAQQRANELRRVLSAEIQARQGGAESSETRAAEVQAALHAQGERLAALETELAEVAAAKSSKKTGGLTKGSKWGGSIHKNSSSASSSGGSGTTAVAAATAGTAQKESNSFFSFGKSKPAKAAHEQQESTSSSSSSSAGIVTPAAAAPSVQAPTVNAPPPPAREEYHPAEEAGDEDSSELANLKRLHEEREAQWQSQMAAQVSTAVAEAMRVEANIALPKAPLTLCDDVAQLSARLERLERIALSTASSSSGTNAANAEIATAAATSLQSEADTTPSNSKPATPDLTSLSAKEAKAREKAEKERIAKEKKDAAAKEKADKAQAAKEAKEAMKKGGLKKRNKKEVADDVIEAVSAAGEGRGGESRPESSEGQTASADAVSNAGPVAKRMPAVSTGEAVAAQASVTADKVTQQQAAAAAAAAAAQAQEQHAADLAALRHEVSRVANAAAQAAAEAAAQAQQRNDALQERMAGDESRLAELEGDYNRRRAELEANNNSQIAEQEVRRQQEQRETAVQQQRQLQQQQQQQSRWQSELEQMLRRADETLTRADAATHEARQLADSSRAEARAATASMRAELLDQGSSARSRLDAALASHRAELLAEVRSATSAATQECRDLSRQHLTAAEGAAAESTREAQRAVEAAKAVGAAGQSWDDALSTTKASLTALVATEGNALRAVVKAATAAEAAERQRREARALEDSEQRVKDAMAMIRAEVQQRHDEITRTGAQQQEEAATGLNRQLTEAAARAEVATCLHALVDQVADQEWVAQLHASASSVALLGRGVMLGLNRTNELADQLEEYAEEDEIQREVSMQTLACATELIFSFPFIITFHTLYLSPVLFFISFSALLCLYFCCLLGGCAIFVGALRCS